MKISTSNPSRENLEKMKKIFELQCMKKMLFLSDKAQEMDIWFLNFELPDWCMINYYSPAVANIAKMKMKIDDKKFSKVRKPNANSEGDKANDK